MEIGKLKTTKQIEKELRKIEKEEEDTKKLVSSIQSLPELDIYEIIQIENKK